MSTLTTWGYALTDVDALPGIMTLSEFNDITAGKYLTDERVEHSITTLYDKAVTVSDRMILIQLPATFVSEIESIAIDGAEYDSFVLMPNGILRIFGLPWSRLKLWTPLVVRYTAGLPEGGADGLRAILADRVAHALASSDGVQSETAGGISVTYNATWANGAKATALADDSKEVLSPYRLRGVF